MRSVPIQSSQTVEVEIAKLPQWSDLLRPLSDLADDDSYRGEDGGLYGAGSNVPPASHLAAALGEAARIRPLDRDGRPSAEGRIGLLSVGFSNACYEFREFLRLAQADAAVSPAFVGINAAQRHCATPDWAAALTPSPSGPWKVMEWRLGQAGVTPAQVQVAWMKIAVRDPTRIGDFPEHALRTKEAAIEVLSELKARFPNLRILYLSSRTYGGYANIGVNPEPWAYEGAFAVRWLIRDQIGGCAALNYDAARGAVRAPLLLWGPYLWAAGASGRATDDLVWTREDFEPDGMHPSASGSRKVGKLLLDFLKTDSTGRSWFLK